MKEIWTNASGDIILVYQKGFSWFGYGGSFDFATSEKNEAIDVLKSLGYILS